MGGGVDDRYGVRGKVFEAINKAEYLGSPALVANTHGDCAEDDGALSWLKDQVAGECDMPEQLGASHQSRNPDHQAVNGSLLIAPQKGRYHIMISTYIPTPE